LDVPLARRIMPELEATAPPIPFWFYRVVAGAAEPWGQLRRRRACNNTVRGGEVPVMALRLFLPDSWTSDRVRLKSIPP
jgi:hypothetical protein